MKAADAIIILKSMPAAYRERVEEMIGAAMDIASKEVDYQDGLNTAEKWRGIARGEY